MTQMPKLHIDFLPKLMHILWVAVLLTSACVSPNIGIDTISSNGQLMTVVELSGDPSSYRLKLIDVKEGMITELSGAMGVPTLTHFSPDNRLVLFLGDAIEVGDNKLWTLADISTKPPTPISITIGVDAWFLPSGKLLSVMPVSINPDFKGFDLSILDPFDPDSITVLADDLAYISAFNQDYFDYLAETILTGCPSQNSTNPLLQLLINLEGDIFIFDGRDTVPVIKSLKSNSIEMLVAKHLALNPTWEEIEDTIASTANNEGKVLSEEELAKATDTKINQNKNERLRYTFQVEFASDGTKLLLLVFTRPSDPSSTIVSTELLLIDLTTEPDPITLFESAQEAIEYFAFSPDGQQVIFNTQSQEQRSLYLANPDGTDVRRIVENIEGIGCWVDTEIR